MAFNVDKCKLLRITYCKSSVIKYVYNMYQANALSDNNSPLLALSARKHLVFPVSSTDFIHIEETQRMYTQCIKKIEQIQRNSCRFIFHEYRRDTGTSLLINRLNHDSLYARRLIQQATMFYKIHYSLVDICPPSYIQHANHISSRTDHPLKYCNKNRINAD